MDDAAIVASLMFGQFSLSFDNDDRRAAREREACAEADDSPADDNNVLLLQLWLSCSAGRVVQAKLLYRLCEIDCDQLQIERIAIERRDIHRCSIARSD